MQMKIRNSFIILLSAVIAVLLLSCAFMLAPKTTAHADTEEVAQVSFGVGGSSTHLSLEGAWNNANIYTSATVTLLADVQTTDTLTVESDNDITLDLNGHTITGSGNGSVIRIASDANFTLCDSVGTGVITGGNATNGGGVFVEWKGAFEMTGGTISGNSASGDGGGVFVYSGYFKMSGGTISGNTASGDGGGVFVYRSAIEIPPPGREVGFEILGAPKITGNVSTDDSSNNVYFMSGRTTLVIGELTEGAQIGVNNTGIVATGFTYNGSDKPSKYFIPDNPENCVYVSDEDSGTVTVGHDCGEGELTAEPTCTDDGEKTFTCSVCGETKTEPVEALGHDWDDGTVTTQPTCADAGVKTFTCSRCGETKTEPVDKIAHTLTHHTATAATEEQEGNTEYWSCEVCDKYFSDAAGGTEITDKPSVTLPKITPATPETPSAPAEDNKSYVWICWLLIPLAIAVGGITLGILIYKKKL